MKKIILTLLICVLSLYLWKEYKFHSFMDEFFRYVEDSNPLFESCPTFSNIECDNETHIQIINDTIIDFESISTRRILYQDSSWFTVSLVDFTLNKLDSVSVVKKSDLSIWSFEQDLVKDFVLLKSKLIMTPRMYKDGFVRFKTLVGEGYLYGGNLDNKDTIMVYYFIDGEGYEYYFQHFSLTRVYEILCSPNSARCIL